MRRIIPIIAIFLMTTSGVWANRFSEVKSALEAVEGFPVDGWKYQFPASPGGEKPDLDDSSWQTVDSGHRWQGQDTQVWFRKTVTLPETIGGFPAGGKKLLLKVGIDDDGEIYVNGEKKASFHWNEGSVVLTEKAVPGQKFRIAVLGKNSGGDGLLMFARIELDTAPGIVQECHRYLYKLDTYNRYAQALRGKALDIIESSVALVDVEAARQGDERKLTESLQKAGDALAPMDAEIKRLRCHLVGNAHIDMAWLWPWEETVQVCKDTFTSVLNLMNEYPDFKYCQSQAQAYLWMEERYPEIFKQIQQRVKEGRWEIVGGMWVEPDCNLPSGESFVRQLLYGKRYFKEKFGVDVKVGWTPDSFGYAWSLPQIYKKAGIDCFLTTKMSWNDTTPFPYNLFRWRGPDGSEILGHQTFGSYMEYVNEEPIISQQTAAKTRHGIDDVMVLYGVGDHGGGPSREMIDRGKAFEKRSDFPTIVWGRADEWFASVRPGYSSYPLHDDEIYLQAHRGTYTTQAATKKNNRRSEFAMFCAEELSSVASILGKPYPSDMLPVWRKVLFNQFHDILPGSSIHRVYEDAAKDYSDVFDYTSKTINSALSAIASQADTRVNGTPLLVFNPLSWVRDGLVEIELDGFTNVVDLSGSAVPCQLSADGKKLVFLAEDLPSVGYKVYGLQKRAPRRGKQQVAAEKHFMENDFFRVEFDQKTGNLSRVYDKLRGREVLAGQGNEFLLYEDTPRDFDAWNVDADDMSKPSPVNGLESIKVIETGPVRSAVRITRAFGKSRIEQDVVLYAKPARIDFKTRVSWHEDHKMLKVQFPLAVQSDHATYEIPYAAIKRPSMPKTPEEKAKFEVPAQKWADISDGSYGVSLLNDCKYGHSAEGNILRLSLLRSPKWPDPNADRGDHKFTYSLYPHKDGWETGGTVEAAYELNQPVLTLRTDTQTGQLPRALSFLNVTAPNVIVGAFKKAEDSNAFILRLYEATGRSANVRISLPRPIKEAAETDLMESEIGRATTSGDSLYAHFDPYEIRTFRVEF